MRPLVELCTRSNEARVIGNAAEALANIAPLEADSGTEIVKGGVVWCGGIGAFVELLARSKDLRVLGFAALALARVCVDERSRPQALQEGCLRPLIALLRTVPLPHDAAAEAAKAQAQATAMAADGEQGNDNAEAQTAAAAAAAAIRTDSVTASAALNVLTNACHALENLALFDAARALLVSEGAITPVVKLLAKSPTPALLARAAGVLRNVARHDGSRATIASEGAVSFWYILDRLIYSHQPCLTQPCVSMYCSSRDIGLTGSPACHAFEWFGRRCGSAKRSCCPGQPRVGRGSPR